MLSYAGEGLENLVEKHKDRVLTGVLQEGTHSNLAGYIDHQGDYIAGGYVANYVDFPKL